MSEQEQYLQGNTPIAYFVPMSRNEKDGSKIKCAAEGGDLVPTHVMDVRSRYDVMSEWLGKGEVGGVYRSYALVFILIAATLASLVWAHWAVAAALAFGAGYQYSNMVISHVWNIEWYKGKSMLYTI